MPASIDLEPLYDEHAQALFAFLLNFTRNETDSRDLLQELFSKLARRVREKKAVTMNELLSATLDILWEEIAP